MSDSVPLAQIIELTDKVGRLTNAIEVAERDRLEASDSHKKIREAVDELAHKLGHFSEDDHKTHHDFIVAMIEEKRQKKELRDQVISTLATKGLPAAVIFIAGLAWLGFKTKFGVGE